MEICRRVIQYKSGDIFNMYALGDIHGGTKHCAEDKARRTFKVITEDPFGLWVDMGDSLDCITPTDPRWQSGIMASWLKDDSIARLASGWYCDMVRHAVEARLPYQDETRCLGKIEGNHEVQMRRHKVDDIQENICNTLKVKNLRFSCLYHLCFQRLNSTEKHMFRFFLTHGSGNAQTSGGRTQKLRKIMNQTDALFTIVGHMHDLKVENPPILSSGNSLEIKSRRRIGAISGTFLRTYSQGVEPGYGELRNYDPTSMGYVRFTINPQEELVTALPVYV